MVKIFIFITLLLSISYSSTIYQKKCVHCHKKLPVSIDKYFYRYLLKYSSERETKKAIYLYLKNPTKAKSVMAEAFISRFGVKPKTTLHDNKLKKAINTYWEKYKVFQKLK